MFAVLRVFGCVLCVFDCVLCVCCVCRHPPLGRAGWTFWQYDDNGKIPGISGNVDVDYFAGTMDDLLHLCFP